MGQQHLLVICAPSGVGKQVEHQRADIGKPVRGISNRAVKTAASSPNRPALPVIRSGKQLISEPVADQQERRPIRGMGVALRRGEVTLRASQRLCLRHA